MTHLLRLTPFEELMLYQDAEDRICEAYVRIKLTGRLDRERFNRAFERTLPQHPLLAASVLFRRGRPYWNLAIAADSGPRFLETDRESFLADLSPLDIQQGGMKCHVIENKTSFEWVIQFHHACCDGVGVFQFIQDLLIAYARPDASGSADRLNDQKRVSRELAQRNRTASLRNQVFKIIPDQRVGLIGVKSYLLRNPVPLLPAASPEPSCRIALNCVSKTMDRAATATYFGRARRLGVSVNDLLIHDTFLALDRFREENRVQNEPEDWLRLMIPINMRSVDFKVSTAANIVGSIFLDRKASQIRNRESLLESIHFEMSRIKRLNLAYTFLYSLAMMRLLPGGIRKKAEDYRRNPTAVLSNLGMLFGESGIPIENGYLVIGDARLQGIEILSPLSRNTNVCIAVMTLAEKLSLSMTFDESIVCESQAHRLVAILLEQMTPSNPKDIDE